MTFRIEGGYLAEHRWGFSSRKGKVHGKIAHVYEADEISQLSHEELNMRIKTDLYVDAYADQEVNNYRYKGKNRALGMETAMFMCPSCKSIGTLYSKGNEISCTCGFIAHYEETGMLSNMPNGMNTLTKWNLFQVEELKNQIVGYSDVNVRPLLEDCEIRFYRVGKEYEIVKEKSGTCVAYPDRIVCAGEEIFLIDIPSLSIYARNTLAFTYQNEHCEVKGGERFSALKYKYLFEIRNDKKVV